MSLIHIVMVMLPLHLLPSSIRLVSSCSPWSNVHLSPGSDILGPLRAGTDHVAAVINVIAKVDRQHAIIDVVAGEDWHAATALAAKRSQLFQLALEIPGTDTPAAHPLQEGALPLAPHDAARCALGTGKQFAVSKGLAVVDGGCARSQLLEQSAAEELTDHLAKLGKMVTFAHGGALAVDSPARKRRGHLIARGHVD